MDPNLIIADVRESDIRISRKQLDFARTVRWNLDLYDFPFEQDLVSVIIPAYNAEKTIELSLRSIMIQSYRQLEIIVVNDGSSDNTAGIVGRLAKEDKRIKLINLEKNAGCYPARNAAIRQSRGKYITFQDADDISLKDRIRHQLVFHCLGKTKLSLMRILRSRLTFDEIDVEDQGALIIKSLQARQNKLVNEYRDQPVLGLVTSMFDRELLIQHGLFWENRFGSDAELVERILFAEAGMRIGQADKKLQMYLSGTREIPGLFYRIDTIGVISPEMTGQNLTKKYGTEERNRFENTWRQQFEGIGDYIYPRLTERESTSS
jgi:glycosyltransferase involved in cell wall biosynthesis